VLVNQLGVLGYFTTTLSTPFLTTPVVGYNGVTGWATSGTNNQFSILGGSFDGTNFTPTGITGTTQLWLVNVGFYLQSFADSLEIDYMLQCSLNLQGAACMPCPILTNTNIGTVVTFTITLVLDTYIPFGFGVSVYGNTTGLHPAILINTNYAVGYQGSWWSMVRLA
jgi:hypothetical protein